MHDDKDLASPALGRAARGSVLNVAGALVATSANVGLLVIVARLASQNVAGALFSATSLFLLAAGLSQLGANTGLIYFLSGARARGQLYLAGLYMRIAAGPVLAVALAMALAFLMLAEPLGRALSSGADVDFSGYIRGMAPFLPFAALVTLSLAGTRGLGTMKANAVLDQAVRPALQLAVVSAALVFGADAVAAVGWAAAYAPVAVFSWWWWTRLRDRAAAGVHDGTGSADALAFWRFSAPRALAGFMQIAMQRLDIVLVGAIVGLAEAAVYAAATRFLVVGQMLSQAVSTAVQPLLGEALARGDQPQARELYRSSTAWLMLATWPVYLLLLVFAPTVLEVFGADYTAGGSVVAILCVAMLFATSCGMVDMVLVMAGRPLWNLANVTVAFGVFLSLNLWLIPRLGIEGAAISWASAIFIANAIPLAQVAYSLRLHPFGRSNALAAGVCVIAFAIVPVSIEVAVGSGWRALLLAVGVGLATFVGLVLKFSEALGVSDLFRALRSGHRRTRI